MLFKNARVYRILETPPVDAESLASHLDADRLKECGRLEPVSAGWISPYGRDHEQLVHSAAGCSLIRYGVQEKVLPPAVIREALAERVKEVAERTGKPAGRREKMRLKDEVLMDLLPRAFIKPGHVDAYLDPRRKWLVVDSASSRAADDVATLLRHSVTGLKLEAPDLANRICTIQTDWLEKGQCPEDLDFGDQCDLRDDSDERSTVRCRHQDLTAAEIAQHLRAGKRAVKLGLVWGDRLSFCINEEFALTQVRPLELLQASMEEIGSDDELSELDANFAMTSGEFGALLEVLATLFDWK
jgi:recombination associated protein RdgC